VLPSASLVRHLSHLTGARENPERERSSFRSQSGIATGSPCSFRRNIPSKCGISDTCPYFIQCSFCEGILSNTRWSLGTWDVSEWLEMQIRNEKPGWCLALTEPSWWWWWNIEMGAVQLVRSLSSGLLGVMAWTCHGKSVLKISTEAKRLCLA